MPRAAFPFFRVCRAQRSPPSPEASTPRRQIRKPSGASGGLPIATSASRTGMASRVWILDVDGEDGEASLRALEAEHGALPPTWESLTARGRHVWFCCDCPVPCSTSKIAPGIDVRGDGGYVIVPPSIHPSGRAYAWSVDSADDLATAPTWLLHLARKKPAPTISERALANLQTRRGASPGCLRPGRSRLRMRHTRRPRLQVDAIISSTVRGLLAVPTGRRRRARS